MSERQKKLRLLSFAYTVLIFVSLLALFCVSGKDLARVNSDSTIYADFLGYYRSGRIVLSAERDKIYDRQTQLKFFNELNASRKSAEFIYSQNPPTFLLLITPFALLPLELSFKVWIALSLLSAGAAIAWLTKTLHKGAYLLSSLLICAALLSAPGWICIFVGQMSWFICFFATLFYLGFALKKDWLCGISLALITAKFQYLFFFSMPVIASRRWKVLLWAAASEFLLLGFSAFVLGPDNIINYPSILTQAETTKDYSGVFPEYMISLRGILSIFMSRHDALLASSVLMFASLLPICLLWRKQKEKACLESSAWAMSITICTALLFSAHTHIYDDLLLLLPAALTIPLIAKNIETQTEVSGLEKFWLGSMLAFPFLSWVLFVFCSNNEFLKRTPFAALNILFLILAWAIFLSLRKQEIDKNQAEQE